MSADAKESHCSAHVVRVAGIAQRAVGGGWLIGFGTHWVIIGIYSSNLDVFLHL
jgi:hypothetical protein